MLRFYHSQGHFNSTAVNNKNCKKTLLKNSITCSYHIIGQKSNVNRKLFHNNDSKHFITQQRVNSSKQHYAQYHEDNSTRISLRLLRRENFGKINSFFPSSQRFYSSSVEDKLEGILFVKNLKPVIIDADNDLSQTDSSEDIIETFETKEYVASVPYSVMGIKEEKPLSWLFDQLYQLAKLGYKTKESDQKSDLVRRDTIIAFVAAFFDVQTALEAREILEQDGIIRTPALYFELLRQLSKYYSTNIPQTEHQDDIFLSAAETLWNEMRPSHLDPLDLSSLVDISVQEDKERQVSPQKEIPGYHEMVQETKEYDHLFKILSKFNEVRYSLNKPTFIHHPKDFNDSNDNDEINIDNNNNNNNNINNNNEMNQKQDKTKFGKHDYRTAETLLLMLQIFSSYPEASLVIYRDFHKNCKITPPTQAISDLLQSLTLSPKLYSYGKRIFESMKNSKMVTPQMIGARINFEFARRNIPPKPNDVMDFLQQSLVDHRLDPLCDWRVWTPLFEIFEEHGHDEVISDIHRFLRIHNARLNRRIFEVMLRFHMRQLSQHLEILINDMIRMNIYHSVDSFTLLIRAFLTRNPDINVVMAGVSYMNSKGIMPEHKFFVDILHDLGDQPITAYSVFVLMLQYVKPRIATFNYMFRIFYQKPYQFRSKQRVAKIEESMKSLKIAPDSETLYLLIRLDEAAGNFISAIKRLHQLHKTFPQFLERERELSHRISRWMNHVSPQSLRKVHSLLCDLSHLNLEPRTMMFIHHDKKRFDLALDSFEKLKDHAHEHLNGILSLTEEEINIALQAYLEADKFEDAVEMLFGLNNGELENGLYNIKIILTWETKTKDTDNNKKKNVGHNNNNNNNQNSKEKNIKRSDILIPTRDMIHKTLGYIAERCPSRSSSLVCSCLELMKTLGHEPNLSTWNLSKIWIRPRELILLDESNNIVKFVDQNE